LFSTIDVAQFSFLVFFQTKDAILFSLLHS
jgi:hypothetical protein